MPENHHNHRPAVVWLLMALILAAVMFVAPANAEVVLDKVIDDTAVSSINYNVSKYGTSGLNPQPSKLSITNAENVVLTDFTLIYFSTIYNNNASVNANQTDVTFELSGETVGSGFVTYYRDSELNGYITVSGKFTESLGTGNKLVHIKGPGGASLASCLDGLRITSPTSGYKASGRLDENQMGLSGETASSERESYTGTYTLNRIDDFWHRITIENSSTLIYKVLVQKTNLDKAFGSHVIISGASGEYVNESGNADVFRQIGEPDLPITVNITSVTGNYNFIYPPYIEPPVKEYSDVTVYVQNSQTGALLADAHIVIKDTTTDPWTEVVNQTLTSGHGTISLAKDPGFNPTQYHISATVPGYQQVVPAHFFRVVGSMNVVVEMEPLEGGPVDENNTFLEFYVRDLNANGISNAQVFVDGKMRWTNAQGYTQFEVAKNASYPYSVSKSGYVTIEGTATVADGPRYVVNVVLGPKEIPTNPPASDPGGPGATPTPDRRTNEEKGQAVIDMIADNAEGIGALALICLLMGLLKLMAKW